MPTNIPDDPVLILDQLLGLPRQALEAATGKGQLRGFRYNAYDDGCRLYFLTSRDFFDADSYEEYDEAEKEFRAHFQSTLQAIITVWGPPGYQADRIDYPGDDIDEEASPLHERLYWSGALALAVWRRGECLAYVEPEHQDKELPVMLILGTAVARPSDDVYKAG